MNAPAGIQEKTPAWAGSSPAQASGAGLGVSPAHEAVKKVVVGDLSIDVIGFERHRGNVLCLLSVSTPYTSSTLMLLNKGKFESSDLVDLRKALGEFKYRKENGAEIHEYGAVTQGGFIVFFRPIVLLRDDAVKLKSAELQLSERAKTELYRLLIDARLDILTTLLKASVLPGSTGSVGRELLYKLDLGVWSDLKPLLYTFVSDAKYVYGPVSITFIPYTFKAEVKIKEIRFYTVKAKPKPFYYDGYIIVGLGKKRDIYVVDGGERTLVYHVTPSFTYVHEQYRNTVFPPAAVTTGYFENRKWSMLHAKLGNIVLVPENADLTTAEKLTQLPEKFGKVEVLRGEVFRHDGRVYVKSDDDVVLYHPYRGTLVVRAGTYRVERIEYVVQNLPFEKWRDRVGGVLAELAETNEKAGALLEELRSLKVESLSEFVEKLSGVVGEDLRLLSRTPRPTHEDIETWIKAME